jgi:hypothetical protein
MCYGLIWRIRSLQARRPASVRSLISVVIHAAGFLESTSPSRSGPRRIFGYGAFTPDHPLREASNEENF